jgi:hypothetical protein
VQHAAQARKAFERPQLEELVEQKGRRLAGCGPRARKKSQRRIERGAGAGRRGLADRKRRGRRHGAQKPFGRRRRALDIDVLGRGTAESIAKVLQQSGAAAAASTDEHWNPGW